MTVIDPIADMLTPHPQRRDGWSYTWLQCRVQKQNEIAKIMRMKVISKVRCG